MPQELTRLLAAMTPEQKAAAGLQPAALVVAPLTPRLHYVAWVKRCRLPPVMTTAAMDDAFVQLIIDATLVNAARANAVAVWRRVHVALFAAYKSWPLADAAISEATLLFPGESVSDLATLKWIEAWQLTIYIKCKVTKQPKNEAPGATSKRRRRGNDRRRRDQVYLAQWTALGESIGLKTFEAWHAEKMDKYSKTKTHLGGRRYTPPSAEFRKGRSNRLRTDYLLWHSGSGGFEEYLQQRLDDEW